MHTKYANGDDYTGLWTGKCRHDPGAAVMKYANGDVYTGSFSMSKMHGEGRMVFHTGDRYIGQWQHNEMYHQGVMEYDNGDIYTGMWCCGHRSGKGLQKFVNGDAYDGYWVEGEMCTYIHVVDSRSAIYAEHRKSGTMTYADGSIYTGEWEHDKPHGTGRLISAYGAVLQVGKWVKGAFVG